jgi:tetratricopeptide (TPR) repeat protein
LRLNAIIENVFTLTILGVSVQDIRNLKELSQEIPSGTSKINATMDVSDAVISGGRITNVENTGVLFTNSDRKKGTNPQLTNSQLETNPDHCASGGAALRAGETATANVTQMKLPKVLSQEMPSRSGEMNVTTNTNYAVMSGGEETGIKNILLKIPTSPAERLPKQWNVPSKNNNFIGRSDLLKQIEDHFSQETTPAILTGCDGLGGIGKTQVALEFVWQHYEEYNGVVWSNAESRERLQNDYISLGRELNIIRDDDNINAEEHVRYVKHWLEDPSRAGWLLVYDNADNYKAISEFLPTKGGKILITTRHTADWSQDISVDVFTIEESKDYIQNVLDTTISESDIETLAETLGRLPLALAQAAAFIKHNKMSISDYLGLYKQTKRDSLSSKTLPRGYCDPVFITWDITMKAIRKESLLAMNLLNVCACLASNDIPNFLLEEFANIPKNNPNSEIFEEARGTLICYSMLVYNEQNGNSSIQRLVQEVIWLNWGEERAHNLMDIFNLLIGSFPCYGQTMADYAKKRQLLPHLEAFLPYLEAWQQEEHQLRKDRENGFLRRLLINVANFFRYSRSAEKDREKDYILPLLNYIADGYRSLGNAEKERELLERALAIEERHYGPDHPEVAITLTNLGNAYGDLGDTKKKHELLEQALAIKERHYGLDHPNVATTLNNPSSAYGNSGDA